MRMETYIRIRKYPWCQALKYESTPWMIFDIPSLGTNSSFNVASKMLE